MDALEFQSVMSVLRIVKCLCLILFSATAALAEPVVFQMDAATSEYSIGFHEIHFRVRHPFKTVEGTLSTFYGSLWMDPAKPLSGIRIDARVPIGSMELSDARFLPLAMELTRQPKQPIVTIASNIVDFVSLPSPVAPQFVVDLRPVVTVGEVAAYVNAPLTCSIEPSVLKCLLRTTFKFTDFQMMIPGKLRIPADNEIALEGEINFAMRK